LKDKTVSRLVLRSFGTLILSGALGLVSLAVLYMVMMTIREMRYLSIFYEIGYGVYNAFNGLSLIFVWFMLFLLYYGLLQWLHYRTFGRVNDTVRRMADGQLEFHYRIPIRGKSAYAVLGSHVNRLSERLQSALEEERRAEQTKNELITNVSHDLRTPLTSVIGYLGLIEQDRYRDEVELRHYTQIAYEKSLRLNVLINDLFEYTRMRNDTVDLKPSVFNLVEMLGQLLVQYDVMLREAGMEGKLHREEPTVMLHADADKMVRVFENLISNAMTYGKEGKRIDIYIRRLDARTALAEVVNYGEPIPAIDLPHIFDRFYRVDKARSQWSGGSGLGLAISKSIVEKHGGTIEATSDSRRTSFRVRLPIHLPGPGPRPPAH
jgi:Signal transduction histidine kinase